MASTNPAEVRAAMEETVRSCLTAHRDGAARRDASVISRGLSPSCRRHIVPASFRRLLGAPADDGFAFANGAYEDQFAADLEVSAVARTDILDLTVDVSARRAAARTDNALVLAGGGGGGVEEEIRLEFAWFFELSADGREITKIVEFCDSAEGKRFQDRVDELREEKRKEKKKAAGTGS